MTRTLGRGEVIKLRFGNILEHAEGYSILFFGANWARPLWRKIPAEYFRYGKVLRRYLCIWRCQNGQDGPKEWENIVEGDHNGF